MAFCSKCGAQMEDDVKVCPACGYNTEEKKAVDISSTITDTADRTAEFDPTDIANNKVMAVLAYLGWLLLITILAAPNSKFARFHANQGIILFICGFIPVLNFIAFIFCIIGIVNVVNGKAKELPIIGKIKILK